MVVFILGCLHFWDRLVLWGRLHLWSHFLVIHAAFRQNFISLYSLEVTFCEFWKIETHGLTDWPSDEMRNRAKSERFIRSNYRALYGPLKGEGGWKKLISIWEFWTHGRHYRAIITDLIINIAVGASHNETSTVG